MRQATVDLLMQWIDRLAPFDLAEEWDNCGLQIGDPGAVVSRVLVALDPTSQTLSQAIAMDCQAMVTHHPLLLKAVKSIRFDTAPGAFIRQAVTHGIHLIAAHTNLDVAVDGTNHSLASLLDMAVDGPLEGSKKADASGDRYAGLGLVGNLPEPMTLEKLAVRLAELLGSHSVRFVGDAGASIQRVGLCTGSGAGLWQQAVRGGCHALITGDVKYHDAQAALDNGLALVDVGHFASERIMVAPLVLYLTECAAREGVALEVFASDVEKDPFTTLVVR
ncbi:dinuclear metal center protein, YbgI/SA1388 family [Desulfacinum hydrothermale DSM 13146]|uniref:GTP cyclohydrolase 1 type 2 homolog n=1 Tax=Desulfacinum hydrothermale DSM 13146 TaxID=1121390 RepID=A0A1W1XJ38_9BACT|nr:Nif3-like dinuclear metal center hexameric protein [Desulfacinum hydrothermale]SMC23996.1 dinuclear metal center protein, YbgI/SA1388 family [Desulfacinum hydrothermale DSM 13146]